MEVSWPSAYGRSWMSKNPGTSIGCGEARPAARGTGRSRGGGLGSLLSVGVVGLLVRLAAAGLPVAWLRTKTGREIGRASCRERV